jgi:hypothetical protein
VASGRGVWPGSEFPRYFDHDELRGDSLLPWQQHLSKIFIPVTAAPANAEIHCARPQPDIAKIAIRRRCSDPSTTPNSQRNPELNGIGSWQQ